MLEKLRHFLSGKTLFVVVGLLAIPFVFLGNSTVGSIFTNYGTVNGLEVTQTDIQSASGQIERQYQSIFGDEFTIDQIDAEQFVRLLENQIIGQKIIQSAARSNGLEISVDDAKREIIKFDDFKDTDNKFSEAIFEATIRGAGLLPEEYIDLVQNSLSANNIIDTVNNANIIIDQERIDFIRAMETKRDIKFIKADLNEISDQQDASLIEAEEYYNNNQLVFLSEEKRQFKFIELKQSTLQSDIQINDADILASYEDYVAQSKENIQKRISHIMLEKENFDDVDQAIAILEETKSKILAGELSFDKAVESLSQDDASIDLFGDLGFSSGDAFPEEFELALLEMEVGSISNVIELEDTIHIIKFTELLSDELLSYEEMIDSLRKELLDLETADRVDELLANVEDQILSGASLANLELVLSSPSLTTEPIEQASLQEVFDGFDNISAFYSNNFQPGDIEVVEQDDGFVVIELTEIVNPQIELFENVVEKALAEVRTTKSLVELNKVDEYAESVLRNDSDQSLPIGFNAETFKEITRNSSIVSSDVLEKVFSLQVGEYFNISSFDGSKYWVFILEENEPSEFDINEKSELYGEYFEQFNNQRNSFLFDQKLRENLKVNIKNLSPTES
ncbi:SurA N-terminal domain-containing protein [SAR86 cluster bacterium]|nr:SurA N-terminal domain-containing protein [SAR86 cluster bacterium]